MKERPILFSAPMVRAILEGRKTQTRRVVKLPARCPDTGAQLAGCELAQEPKHVIERVCPYGAPGDLLWVRETLACTAHHGVWYAADEDGFNNLIKDPRADELAARYGSHYFEVEQRNIPSIHMPRWASRITLKVTDVRVERLRDINYGDAQAEGWPPGDAFDPITWYSVLWRDINGPDSWAANPWVWVVSFERVKP